MSARATIFGVLFAFLGLMLAIALLDGCTPAERAAGRAAVVTTAEAIHAADVACAEIVRVRGADGGRELGERCRAEYDQARLQLIMTANAVDSWDTLKSSRESVTCDVVHAMAFIERLADIIRAAGGKVPPIIDDARSLVSQLGACTGGAL